MIEKSSEVEISREKCSKVEISIGKWSERGDFNRKAKRK